MLLHPTAPGTPREQPSPVSAVLGAAGLQQGLVGQARVCVGGPRREPSENRERVAGTVPGEQGDGKRGAGPAGRARGTREGGLGGCVGELGLRSVPGSIRGGRVRACSLSAAHPALPVGLSPARHLPTHLRTRTLRLQVTRRCRAPAPPCENRDAASRPHYTGALVSSHAQRESTAATLALGCALRAGHRVCSRPRARQDAAPHALVSLAPFSPRGMSPSLDVLLRPWHREGGGAPCRGQRITAERLTTAGWVSSAAQ